MEWETHMKGVMQDIQLQSGDWEDCALWKLEMSNSQEGKASEEEEEDVNHILWKHFKINSL